MRLLALLLLFGFCDAQVIIVLQNPVPPATAPVIVPNGGTFTGSAPFTITSPLGGSVIYTVNGTTPSVSNGVTCASPCAVTALISLTARTISVVSGYSVSEETDATFVINPPGVVGTPTFSPDAGTFHSGVSVTISTATPAATCYYTTDGSTPTTGSTAYVTPIPISSVGATTLKSLCAAASYTNSAVFTGVYNYNPPAATPTISPAAGTYTTSVTVTITGTGGCTVYYTTNNTAPTTLSTVYSAPFTLNASATVQAMQTCTNYSQSAVASTAYTVTQPQPAPTPTFSTPTSSTSPITVTISDTAPSPSIYYCTAPCTPTTASTLYTAPFVVSSTTTINAIAISFGYLPSAVGSATYTITAVGPPSACSGSAGSSNGLVVNPTITRSSGISPLLVFFDATNTTSSNIAANTTTFQDVTYTWNFGDTGASGTGNWAYGSNPNRNSKNVATGGIAAHLYITAGANTPYTATVTATDGVASVTCTVPIVTAYDPTSAPPNGFGGVATTCVSAAATPVAGVGGCPVGAAVLKSASYTTALGAPYMGNGKQVLFHCGESFTGGLVSFEAQKASIGAYGGCQGTQNNRPVFIGAAGGNLAIGSGSSADFDIRISDLDLEGGGNTSGTAIYGNSSVMPYQITVWNVISHGNAKSFYDYNASQVALVQFVMNGMGNYQGVYLNNSENQCTNNSGAYGCGGAGFVNINYNAIIGSLLNGVGATTANGFVETLRIPACRMCVIENNTIENAVAGGAVLKMHNGNKISQAGWTGQYTELNEISDNLFTGISGAQLVEIAPQNSQTDERLRNIVFERNLMFGSSGSVQVLVSGQNMTLRDNVTNGTAGNSTQYPFQIARRGIEYGNVATGTSSTSCPNSYQNPAQCTGSSAAPFYGANTIPEYIEVYNNTCIQQGGKGCVAMSNVGCCTFSSGGSYTGTEGSNSWMQNNLLFNTGGGNTVVDNGTNDTVSNNTVTVTNNPLFKNASTTFSVIPDFIPTANYSGATAVPVQFDALGNAWPPTWDLGAVSHNATSPTTYKFFTGDAAMSEQYQHNVTSATWQADIAALKANPVPGGNSAQMYVAGWRWPFLESGPPNNLTSDAVNGTGQFAGFTSAIYAAYSYLESQIPGASFGISLMGVVAGGNYSASVITSRNWSTTGLVVPGDIATAGGTGTITVPVSFGSATTMTCQIAPIYTGASYGGFAFYNFDGTDMQYAVPAFWNPCVNQRFINFYQALSLWQYVAPPGHPLAGQTLTLDTDPLTKYIFSNDEDSYTFNSGSSNNPVGVTVSPPLFNVGASPSNTPSNTNAYAAYLLWAQQATSFFPHTLIGDNFSFGFQAQHGNDTNLIVPTYVNQNITGQTALSTVVGLAASASDTIATWFTGATPQASWALQGYIGISAPPNDPPGGLGTVTNQSLAGYTPIVAQVQPGDYGANLQAGCTKWTTCAVTGISAAANSAQVQANMRIWAMGDSNTNGTTAWTTYIAPTLNHAAGTAGVTPYSTVRPANLP